MGKILVVDDDNTSRLVLLKTLAQDGHEVLEAPTAVRALQMLEEREEPPDLIISDIVMPFMDGMEFATKVREDPRLTHTPILLCTALADRHTVMRAAKLGIQHYILKPLVPDKVLQQVRSILADLSKTPAVEE